MCLPPSHFLYWPLPAWGSVFSSVFIENYGGSAGAIGSAWVSEELIIRRTTFRGNWANPNSTQVGRHT